LPLLFTPDGKTIVTANRLDTVFLRDGVTGAELRKLRIDQGPMEGIALSPDGKMLAVACSDGAVRLFTLPDGKPGEALKGHAAGTKAVAFAPDGRTLASSSDDGIRLWDVASGEQLMFIPAVIETRATGLAFAPDGKTLASAGTCLVRHLGAPFIDSDDVRLWNVESGKQTGQIPIKAHAVAFSADGRYLIGGGSGIYGVPPGMPAGIVINKMAFRTMNRVAVWEVTSNTHVASVENLGNAFALSADGRFFAVGRGSEYHLGRHQGGGIRIGTNDNTRTLTVRETLTGQPIHVFPMPEGASGLALSPDGARLAVVRPDGKVEVREVAPKVEKRSLAAEELDRLWRHLGATEAGPAFAAVWSLAGGADEAVPFLKAHLSPVKWDRAKTKKWLDDLDSDDFDVREKAAKELRSLGGNVGPQLRERLTGQVSAEVRRALKDLLEVIEAGSLPPEELRALRAVHALERAATPAARDLLKALASGEPEARLTREATQALDRLGGR
jgi:WD40 repeat protein